MASSFLSSLMSKVNDLGMQSKQAFFKVKDHLSSDTSIRNKEFIVVGAVALAVFNGYYKIAAYAGISYLSAVFGEEAFGQRQLANGKESLARSWEVASPAFKGVAIIGAVYAAIYYPLAASIASGVYFAACAASRCRAAALHVQAKSCPPSPEEKACHKEKAHLDALEAAMEAAFLSNGHVLTGK